MIIAKVLTDKEINELLENITLVGLDVSCTDKEINELPETITVEPSRKSTVKPETRIKCRKDVETNEIKTYEE